MFFADFPLPLALTPQTTPPTAKSDTPSLATVVRLSGLPTCGITGKLRLVRYWGLPLLETSRFYAWLGDCRRGSCGQQWPEGFDFASIRHLFRTIRDFL